MVFKIFIVFILFAILFSLGSGLIYLLKDPVGSRRTVKALTVRIGISLALFFLLLIAFAMGWIQPHQFGGKNLPKAPSSVLTEQL